MTSGSEKTFSDLNHFESKLPALNARFGAGSAKALSSDCKQLGIHKLMVIGTPSARDRYSETLDPLHTATAAHFFKAQPHCPVETVEACRQAYRRAGCNGVVAIGGGSTLGLGKILAAEEGAIFIAVPTTYSGTEATAIFGRKIDGEKRTVIDDACRPSLIVYDPELSQSLPADITVMTGMNSVAHAVDALYGQNSGSMHIGPLTIALAREALFAHQKGLSAVVHGEDNIANRQRLLYAGFLGGLLISMHGIAIHHRLCHVIGGLFDVPHGATNSIILPHAVAYNTGVVPQADQLIQEVFEGDNPAKCIYQFTQSLNAPADLREFGVPESAATQIAQHQIAHGGWNPREVTLASLTELVKNAINGYHVSSYP